MRYEFGFMKKVHALFHSESVLFVYHHQSELPEFYFVLYQAVRADKNLHLVVFYFFQKFFPVDFYIIVWELGRNKPVGFPREQAYGYLEGRERLSNCFV